jgi:hypothetical protein
MTQPDNPPGDSEIAEWVGDKAYEYWKHVTRFIERNYPNIFIPEWLFGGKKHGWSLRYKKSKSFCTLIPEKDRFSLLIVFGVGEREKVASIRDRLSAQTLRVYDDATTYHDGKWVRVTVDSATIVEDVRQLLALKRKPSVDKGA